jgi:hypothetical protein
MGVIGLKGKRRDEAATDYLCGAASALCIVRGIPTDQPIPDEHKDVKALVAWLSLSVIYRGYKAVVEMAGS